MSGMPAEEGPGPKSPPAAAKADTPILAAAHQRSRRKTIVTPIVLGVLGLVAGLAAILLYLSTTAEPPTPEYSRVAISATFPLSFVHYEVFQINQATAEVKVLVNLTTAAPPVGASPASVSVAPPLGTVFQDCPPEACVVLHAHGLTASDWTKKLVFESAPGSNGFAIADFFVKASSFGATSNGVTAAAAIPEVLYGGGGRPVLLASYHIPSASSYDWSSFPTAAADSVSAIWQETLTTGDNPGKVAVGTDHAGQASQNIKIFIAGALVGIAGGAVVSVIQQLVNGD